MSVSLTRLVISFLNLAISMSLGMLRYRKRERIAAYVKLTTVQGENAN
jgi:hypothetical protein